MEDGAVHGCTAPVLFASVAEGVVNFDDPSMLTTPLTHLQGGPEMWHRVGWEKRRSAAREVDCPGGSRQGSPGTAHRPKCQGCGDRDRGVAVRVGTASIASGRVRPRVVVPLWLFGSRA